MIPHLQHVLLLHDTNEVWQTNFEREDPVFVT